MFFKSMLFSIFITSFLATGCAGTAARYEPIVDGERNAAYRTDLEDCQLIATQRSYLNDDVKSDAALGSGIGALIGAAENGIEGAVGGAVLGALVGGSSRSWKTREDRKAIVIECMQQRGHQVVG